MADLGNLSLNQLQDRFGEKTGNWLHGLGKGIENDPVNPRQLSKSIGCGKHFFGKSALRTQKDVKHWLMQFAEELVERGSQDQKANKRMAKVLTVSVKLGTSPAATDVTRSCSITSYDSQKICQDAFILFHKFNEAKSELWAPPILSMAMSIGKFQDNLQGNKSMDAFLLKSASTANESKIPVPFTLTKSFNVDDQGTRKVEATEVKFPTKEPENNITESKSKSFFLSKLEKLSKSSDIAETPSRELQDSDNLQSCKNPSPKTALQELPKISVQDVQASKGIMRYMKPQNKDENTRSSEYDDGNITFDVINNMDCNILNFDAATNEIECSECNKKIPAELIDEHIDFHFAYRLQKEFDAIVFPAHSNISNDENTENHLHCSNKDSVPLSGTVTCTQCKRKISTLETKEHEDFHMAQKLQEEFNAASVPIQTITKSTSNHKSKRRKQVSDNKIRSLDSYFISNEKKSL